MKCWIWVRATGEVRLAASAEEAIDWQRTADVTLARDVVGDAEVSTVFLTVDHNFTGNGPPVLWETMVFGGPSHGLRDRYVSLEEAANGHARIVADVTDASRGSANP